MANEPDIGLEFFVDARDRATRREDSVFGTVDQDQVLSRLGIAEDEDVNSGFFGDDIIDVESASTRVFDTGIRTITEEPEAIGAAAPFRPSSIVAAAARPVLIVPGVPDDPAARRAFILGGPRALAS